jgi:hypothetical protein
MLQDTAAECLAGRPQVLTARSLCMYVDFIGVRMDIDNSGRDNQGLRGT